MTNSYLIQLDDEHNSICMRLQENLPTDERITTELKFEELTRKITEEIQSYCL